MGTCYNYCAAKPVLEPSVIVLSEKINKEIVDIDSELENLKNKIKIEHSTYLSNKNKAVKKEDSSGNLKFTEEYHKNKYNQASLNFDLIKNNETALNTDYLKNKAMTLPSKVINPESQSKKISIDELYLKKEIEDKIDDIINGNLDIINKGELEKLKSNTVGDEDSKGTKTSKYYNDENDNKFLDNINEINQNDDNKEIKNQNENQNQNHIDKEINKIVMNNSNNLTAEHKNEITETSKSKTKEAVTNTIKSRISDVSAPEKENSKSKNQTLPRKSLLKCKTIGSEKKNKKDKKAVKFKGISYGLKKNEKNNGKKK